MKNPQWNPLNITRNTIASHRFPDISAGGKQMVASPVRPAARLPDDPGDRRRTPVTGVHGHGGTWKWWVYKGRSHLKWMIWGYPYFRKPLKWTLQIFYNVKFASILHCQIGNGWVCLQWFLHNGWFINWVIGRSRIHENNFDPRLPPGWSRLFRCCRPEIPIDFLRVCDAKRNLASGMRWRCS